MLWTFPDNLDCPQKEDCQFVHGYASIFRLILGLSVNTPYLIFDELVLGLDAQHRDLFTGC